MPVSVKRILLDAFKPRESSIIELSKAICSADGVEEVDVIVSEVDSKTETIKVTIRGQGMDYDKIAKVMERHGVSIKGVDEISVARV